MAKVARKATMSGGKSLVPIKDRYPKVDKNKLAAIEDKYPKVDKNKLSSIRDKSSTGANKDMLKPIATKKATSFEKRVAANRKYKDY